MKFNILIFLILTNLSLFSIPNFKTPYIYSARQGGMGNAFTAVADDEFLLFANPAGLGRSEKFLKYSNSLISYINFFKFGFQNLFNIIDTYYNIVDNKIDYSDISTYSYLEKMDRIPIALKISSLSFSYLTENWGITFTPIADIRKFTATSDIVPSASINMFLTAQLSIGFIPLSFSFFNNDVINFGIAIRPFYLLNIDSYLDVNSVNSISLDTLDTLYYEEGIGVAIDTGILWEKNLKDGNKINFGLAIFDAPAIYYPITTKYLNKSVEIGFLQTNPKIGITYYLPNYLDFLFMDTLFSIDFHRWIDSTQGWATKIHIGASTSIIKFDQLNINLNLGINGGYLTSSTIFYFYNIQLSYLFYQEEIGYKSGANNIQVHEFSFSLYI